MVGGKQQKSVPAEVRREHVAELKALKQTISDVEKALPAHRERVEALLRVSRSWPLALWKERYLDHPLVSTVARRLIWHFQDSGRLTLGTWHDGRLATQTGQNIEPLGEHTQVSLWHPIVSAPETVAEWRRWFEEHGVTQPFKQAHREVYTLTDAEIATGTYSNRFAGHLLKQHQFKALCDQKGWRYRLQGAWDNTDDSVARLSLPQDGLRPEFWVYPVGHDEHAWSDSHIYLYISTDQVRFCGSDGQPRPLQDVPPLCFSEVMRDVDLFVSVANVGNDPEWQDSRGTTGYREYWQRYAFGDLSATANTRRQVLQRLLPRLKIATRCALEGRFLIVRGDLRTYKIHLGSSNILMEPNDQYLCIVPDSRRSPGEETSQIMLPFEGDRTLSLILSKAFLLAEDKKIVDRTILSQIARS